MKFSERIGAVLRVVQKGSMDEALKNALWNATARAFWHEPLDYRMAGAPLLLALWADHFNCRADEFPETPLSAVASIKKLYLSGNWASAYDFVEFVAGRNTQVSEEVRTTAEGRPNGR